MIDDEPGAEPGGRIDAWLVTDAQCELISAIRRLACSHGIEPAGRWFSARQARHSAQPVVHTNHPAFGYRIEAMRR